MRISRHQMYLEIARTVSKRSTCHRLNVGAVIVLGKDPGLLTTGYNGVPPGEYHCEGNGCPLSTSGGCTRARHAEWNAIDRLHPQYMGAENLVIYCTHSPCPNCVDHIINAGIKQVYFETAYRNFEEPVTKLLDKGIDVFRYTPSGYLINLRTNEISES